MRDEEEAFFSLPGHLALCSRTTHVPSAAAATAPAAAADAHAVAEPASHRSSITLSFRVIRPSIPCPPSLPSSLPPSLYSTPRTILTDY